MNGEPSQDNLKPACPRAADAAACLLGELPAPARADFEKHAAACPACAAALETAGFVIGRLRAAPEAACPPDLARRVMDRVGAERPTATGSAGGRSLRSGLVLRLAAGILVVAGLGGIVLLRRDPGGRACGRPSVVAREADTVAARQQARAWLRKTQRADGGWEAGAKGQADNYDVGVSALALIALMPGQNAPMSTADCEVVRKGIHYLLDQQDPEGLFGPRFSASPYNQGLATLALLEACALESDPSWRTAAERGLRFIRAIQDEKGGWGYLRSAPGAVNSSISIWPLLALMRADRLGVPDLLPDIERGLERLRAAVGADGLVGYRRAGDAPYGSTTLTAAGAICLLRARSRTDEGLVDRMLPAIQEAAVDPNPSLDLYETFFVAQALATLPRSSSATDLLSSVTRKVLAEQVQAGPQAGSWQPADRWCAVGGPVCATALAALSISAN